jgi:hypothetical protein
VHRSPEPPFRRSLFADRIVPVFLVPLFLMLHAAALMQSRRMIRGRA